MNSKKHFAGKVLTVALAAAVTTGCLSTAAIAAEPTQDGSQDYKLAQSIQEGTILHCFDWKYTDITAELENIAKAGFTSIQTSPVQAPVKNDTWKWLYQPLGFSFGTNVLGTKEELRQLCEEADKYGIKIVVDVVANHLASEKDSVDEAFKAEDMWHNEEMEISNYYDRNEITHYDLGMPDLNSENEKVQKIVADFVSELKELGVDGIRWDAAKHIGLPSEGCNFWPAVTASGLYNYGEILTAPKDGTNKDGSKTDENKSLMSEYTKYMSVTDSSLGTTLIDSFKLGKAPASASNWVNDGISADKLVYWGESHDTYANNKGKESNGVDQNVIDRAYAVAAAFDGSTALYLSRPGTAEPGQMMAGDKGSMHFTSAEIAAVNHFHNAMNGKESSYAVTDNTSVVTRKDGGAVIVCGSGSGAVSVENASGYVPAGIYKDEVTGNTFTVTDTTISGTVGESGIAVVYNSSFASRVEASVEPGASFDGTLSVTLKAIDVTDAKYSTSEGDEGSFSDGDVITIGSKTESGEITVILTATTSDGQTMKATYKYYKSEAKPLPKLSKGGVIFDNSVTQWKTVNAYIYDEVTFKTTVTNAQWPGVAMTDAGDDLYTYELPEAFKDCKNIMVIFNSGDGGSQFPGAMEAGLTLNYNEVKFFDAAKKFSLVYTVSTDDGKTDDGKTDDGKTDDKTDDGKTDDKTDDGKTDDKTDDGKTDGKTDNGKTDDGKTDSKTDDGKTDGKTDDNKSGNSGTVAPVDNGSNGGNTQSGNNSSVPVAQTSDSSAGFATAAVILTAVSAAVILFSLRKKREQ